MNCKFTMVPFSITTSKHSLLKGKSSMSASSTLISDDRGDREKPMNKDKVKAELFFLTNNFSPPRENDRILFIFLVCFPQA